MRDERPTHTGATPILPPFPKVDGSDDTPGRAAAFATWVKATRPMRALQHWASCNGGLLASGMAYSALFSFFAALLLVFSIAGVVLVGRPDLIDQLIGHLGDSIPGLVGDNGVVSAEALRGLGGSLTLAGAVSLVSMLWTAMSFLNNTRRSVRAIFELPVKAPAGFVRTRVRDLGLMLMFMVLLLISVALTASSSGLLNWLLSDVLGFAGSPVSIVLLRLAGVLISLAFDALVIGIVLRLLSAIRIPRGALMEGALLGGIGITALKQLGSLLLGGATSNPLLATFGALLGVLIFFNLMCMVLLITAAWVKVTMDDLQESPQILTAGEADEIAQQTELLARRQRLAADRIRLEGELERLPRGRRRRTRREWEAVVSEQELLEARAERDRLGYDPEKPLGRE